MLCHCLKIHALLHPLLPTLALMACVGVDLFEFGGKSHLVCVDRWSGYPLFSQLSSTSTAAVINTLKTWFNVLGWPRVIRSDCGHQFRGEFSEFCRNFRISHELSSPYNPRANGLAESKVKIVKNMLHKCLGEVGISTDAANASPTDQGY